MKNGKSTEKLPNISKIEENLYIGNVYAANDVSIISQFGITHILTVDIVPLSRECIKRCGVTIKFIHLSDQRHEEILPILEETNRFIEQALCTNGTVLIHCHHGISRSAAFTIAYLMKRNKLNFTQSLNLVKEKRPIVCPNKGFRNQLELYYEMNYRIDMTNKKFLCFTLSLAARYFKKFNILPQSYFKVIKDDPGLTQAQPDPHVYRCMHCRRVLATESNLLTHINCKTNRICVNMYFLEPLSWMNVTQRPQGKLLCPKCNRKLGSFRWTSGTQCPCGIIVAPAFYIVPSKVDYSIAVKNVQATF